MGLLSNIFGSNADKTAKLVEATGNAFDNLFTSDEERDAAQIVKQKIAQNPAMWAHQLNMAEASGNWFNSGWRPALGWVGAVSLFTFYVPQYLTATYLWVNQCLTANEMIPYPVGVDGVMELVLLLLGGAALRTTEKFGGVNSK